MRKRSLAVLLAVLLAGSCSEEEAGEGILLGDFRVVVDGRSVSVMRSDGTMLLEGIAAGEAATSTGLPGPVAWRAATPEITTAFGMYLFEETAPAWSAAPDLQVRAEGGGKLELAAGGATGTFEAVGKGLLRITWSVTGKGTNRFLQSFVCGTDERFFGTGARVHGTEHRGETIPAWVSEQGMGKIRRTMTSEGFPVQGDIHDTYLAIPFVMSSRGFGLLVEDSRRSLFHLCPAGATDRWAVEIWRDKLQLLVLDGPGPGDVLQRLTAITGRPRLPPKWAFAPWVDAIKGQSRVQAVADQLRAEGVPASVLWTEDWVGGSQKYGGYNLAYHWDADTTLYPDLKSLASSLHAQGFRFLGYFNPFLEKGYKQYTEALQKGCSIKDSSGKPVEFLGVYFTSSTMPDLTDAAARTWVQGYLKKALALGFDGWMTDFGEWLPTETLLTDGTTGLQSHNLYPVQWQRVHRELLDQVRPDGDYVFFVRSGYSGTGGLAPVVWAGDQQTEFGGLDGMASVIPLCVNSGMSGIPIMTHDIAGYSSFNISNTTRELFFRWTELGALSPIMRTHHGLVEDKNWHWNTDAATIALFRKYARIHTDLFPYRYSLAKEATKIGLPMMRHMVLHHPKDSRAARIKDQFLLGPFLLVAPVQADRARSRKVYLPAGTWYDYFSGVRLEGGKDHLVQAGLEQIPVFAPAGAIVPTFLTQVDTLDRSTSSKVKDIIEAEQGPLGVSVFLGQDSTFDLYDGTRFSLTHSALPSASPSLSASGQAAWPACSATLTEGCIQSGPGRRVVLCTGKVTGLEVTATGSGKTTLFVFEARSLPRARKLRVTFQW